MKNLLIIIIFLSIACTGQEEQKLTADIQEYPDPVDTRTRDIEYQSRGITEVGDVAVSNDFPAARLNSFEQVNDTLYRVTVSPENTPINHSPWYAFKIWSDEDKTVNIELNYTEHFHRYPPKVSSDGESWTELDSTVVRLAPDSVNAFLRLEIGPDTLWVAAQEIQDHRRVGEWTREQCENVIVECGEAGMSAEGRSLYFIDITKGEKVDKPAVIIISRQHPPEVTGFLAMKAFVETIINEGESNGFLDRFRVMVYPLMNPDGVDLGHFRHNTGGVDLNRDWAEYNQPEVRQVADHMVRETVLNKNEVLLGLDFHSTWEDVYYTFDESLTSKLPEFTSEWLNRIQDELQLDDINEQPSGLGQPVSKSWFYQQFKAESITYEIGDRTPRDFIKVKGEVSARAMMDILMKD